MPLPRQIEHAADRIDERWLPPLKDDQAVVQLAARFRIHEPPGMRASAGDQEAAAREAEAQTRGWSGDKPEALDRRIPLLLLVPGSSGNGSRSAQGGGGLASSSSRTIREGQYPGGEAVRRCLETRRWPRRCA